MKTLAEARAEALTRLDAPELYETSSYDLGYRSTTDECGQDMMLAYYRFTFEPIAGAEGRVSGPRFVEVQAHMTAQGCL